MGLFVTLGLLLLAVLGGLYFWYTHPVDVTIDGTRMQARLWSPLEQVMDEKGISVSSGDYVSVSGNVISAGDGYPFSATVNGSELNGSDASGYHIKEGDVIDFHDGADRMEEFDSWEENIQPKLKMDGNVGAINYVAQWGKAGRKTVRRGKDSGETADGETLTEPQDCIIKVTDVHPDDDRKIVALTFDDGPDATYTLSYLSILNQYNAKATFFCVGNNVQAYPSIVQEAIAEGNEVMNHTMSHQQLTDLDEDALRAEITDSFDAIEQATGVQTTALRPPYGSFRETTWLKTGGCMSLSVRWNLDSLDWSKASVQTIVANATNGVEPGSIILMHDGGGDRSEDLEALPQILATLEDEGYTVTTVSELLASDSSIPSGIADEEMPEDCVWPQEIDEADLAAAS